MPHVSSRPPIIMDFVGSTICVVGFRQSFTNIQSFLCWPSYNRYQPLQCATLRKIRYFTFYSDCTIYKCDVHASRLQSKCLRDPRAAHPKFQSNTSVPTQRGDLQVPTMHCAHISACKQSKHKVNPLLLELANSWCIVNLPNTYFVQMKHSLHTIHY